MERNIVRFELDAGDLAETRFGIWPTHELAQAVAVIQDPHAHPLQWGWLRTLTRRLPANTLDTLRTAIPPHGYMPDFLTPAPTAAEGPRGQLARISAGDPAHVERDLRKAEVRAEGRRRATLRAWGADPEHARDQLAEAMTEAWDALLEPWWDTVLRMLEADIATRSRTLARHGFAQMANTLHERVSYADGVLAVELTRWQADIEPVHGVMLIPSVFSWPGCSVQTEGLDPPLLCYPVGGLREDWTRPDRRLEALAVVIGPGRLRIISALREPRTTSEVAALADLSVSATSEHLASMRAAGWVVSERTGRSVHHVLSPTGEILLA